MKLDQLHYFVQTARRQHIGKAANFLHISPSAISHSISALEEELGKPLFTKQGRQIILTKYGKILLERAEYLLAEVESIREELASDQCKLRGHYRLAATQVLCSDFLTPIWLDIQKQHPGLTAVLYSSHSGEVLSRVNAREVDLGFCFCPHSSPNHEQEIIHEGRLIFCFGQQHPFLKNCRFKDIEKFPAIAPQPVQGVENCQNHPAFRKYNIKPQIINLFDSYDVAIRAVKSNTVWSLIPDFLAYHHDIQTYVPKDWDATYSIVAIWPKSNSRTTALDRLIDNMRIKIKKIAKVELT